MLKVLDFGLSLGTAHGLPLRTGRDASRPCTCDDAVGILVDRSRSVRPPVRLGLVGSTHVLHLLAEADRWLAALGAPLGVGMRLEAPGASQWPGFDAPHPVGGPWPNNADATPFRRPPAGAYK